MAPSRYAQLCPLARAAEIVGERWTLLVIRQLFAGPQRFTDLKAALPGVSPSVLAERMQGLEQSGLVAQHELPPPAASRVYALTEAGSAFEPALREIARWGLRFLFPARDDDRIDAGQVLVACKLFARAADSPALAVRLVPVADDGTPPFRVVGGPDGTHIEPPDGACDLQLRGPPMTLILAASGMAPVAALLEDASVRVDGDASRLGDFPNLFDFAGNQP